MKDKLQLLINSESNLTRSAFAEMLEIQPATISHILSGRNKPSYELLQKILLRFPNVNADWLIADRGEMLRDASLSPSGIPRAGMAQSAPDAGDMVGNLGALADSALRSVEIPAAPSAGIQGSFFDKTDTADIMRASGAESQTASAVRDMGENPRRIDIAAYSQCGVLVERVVVFYADKTFDTYIPKK